MNQFFYITNVSGQTYWSRKGKKTDGYFIKEAIEKYGEVYVNRRGGWFPKDAIVKIEDKVIQKNWPPQ